MRRLVLILVAVIAALALAGAAYAYNAAAERRYAEDIGHALDDMLAIVRAESEVVDLWSTAVDEGYEGTDLPPASALAAADVLSQWRGLQSDVAAIRPPAKHQQSYDLVVASIELRIDALETLVEDPMSEEYDRLWGEAEAKLTEYQRVIREEVGAK